MFRSLIVFSAFPAVLAEECALDEISLMQMKPALADTSVEDPVADAPPINTDWPAAWPPAAGDAPHGPWQRRGDESATAYLESLTDENRRYHASMFAKYPLIGSVALPKGPMKGERVPFPHTVQDAEGLGFVGTADAAKVAEVMPKPWEPVLTVDGRATWATWKDVERVNMLGQVCQRQWVAFYAQHPDHSFPPVESPVQLLYGQFAGFHLYSYTHQMYTDCETVVEIDRNMYGWDSHLATHDYHRDIHGNLDWTVTSGGEQILDMHVSMPYGPETILAHMDSLQKYGNGGELGQSPEQFLKFVKQRQQQFMWLSKPGIMPIKDSKSLTPVIHSPFGEVDTERYPSTQPGDTWDTNDGYFESSYYDERGPFGVKMPMAETDYLNWGGEFADFDMQTGSEFSLAFYTHHFQMIWNSPWTFVPVNDGKGMGMGMGGMGCTKSQKKACKMGAKAGFCPCGKKKMGMTSLAAFTEDSKPPCTKQMAAVCARGGRPAYCGFGGACDGHFNRPGLPHGMRNMKKPITGGMKKKKRSMKTRSVQS